MNNFVDYVDQLSEYVAIEFERCGMTDAKLNELEETRKSMRMRSTAASSSCS